MSCPVIHKVTDVQESGGKCPVDHGVFEINFDDISDTPSLKEYKELRKVMGMITKFYQSGSEAKKQNYDSVVEELKKLEEDERMCNDQIQALSNPDFKGHPKMKEYLANLEEERSGLEKQKQKYISKRDDCLGLYEWSKTIVKVCEWLELHLDEYCKTHIPDLPPKLFNSMKSAYELTDEQRAQYFKGLDEITYNLDESQDFFQASIDGRLQKYHQLEKRIIESQLEVLKKYPEDSPRRQYIENELQRDSEYVEGNMVHNPEAMSKRERMLKNHKQFCKVLKYLKDKLKALGVGEGVERKYDPRFDHYRD